MVLRKCLYNHFNIKLKLEHYISVAISEPGLELNTFRLWDLSVTTKPIRLQFFRFRKVMPLRLRILRSR